MTLLSAAWCCGLVGAAPQLAVARWHYRYLLSDKGGDSYRGRKALAARLLEFLNR